jgi:hypothetical protein
MPWATRVVWIWTLRMPKWAKACSGAREAGGDWSIGLYCNRILEEVAATRQDCALGLRLLIVYASSQGELDNAVATCVQTGAGGLLVTADALFFNRQKEIVALAARYAIPAIYESRDFLLAGGLTSYGSSTELVAVAPTQLQPALTEPKPKDTAERRQVTVMFSDLVGSTDR